MTRDRLKELLATREDATRKYNFLTMSMKPLSGTDAYLDHAIEERRAYTAMIAAGVAFDEGLKELVP